MSLENGLTRGVIVAACITLVSRTKWRRLHRAPRRPVIVLRISNNPAFRLLAENEERASLNRASGYARWLERAPRHVCGWLQGIKCMSVPTGERNGVYLGFLWECQPENKGTLLRGRSGVGNEMQRFVRLGFFF